MASLVAEHLSKELGGRLVLRDVSLSLQEGECLALFGPNGSGKSTLLNLLSTRWKPTTGRLMWDDMDVYRMRARFRRLVGYVGHSPLLYVEWSGRANLRFLGRLHGVPELEKRIDALLEEVGLEAFADEPVHVYSRGMVQRLTLARAFLHAPRILLLDEPFTGLDAGTQVRLLDRLRVERERGATTLLVTHDIELGYEAATTIAFLRRGQMEPIGRPSLGDLRTQYAAVMNDGF